MTAKMVESYNYSADSVKLSICIMTYNQENYIESCLNSILSQEFNCSFEILVGDDCSTDSTLEKIRSIATTSCVQFKIIKQNKNVGPSWNYLSLYSHARGDYVAHCDGDDTWLPGKLEFQINYLDNNPAVAAVYANAYCNGKLLNPEKDQYFSRIDDQLVIIFTKSYLIHSAFVTRKFNKLVIEEYLKKYNEIFDFEIYYLLMNGESIFISGRPYVRYSHNVNGISKQSGILMKYEDAINRLRNFGLPESTAQKMHLNLKKLKALLGFNVDLNFFEYMSCGEIKFSEIIKIFLPWFYVRIKSCGKLIK